MSVFDVYSRLFICQNNIILGFFFRKVWHTPPPLSLRTKKIHMCVFKENTSVSNIVNCSILIYTLLSKPCCRSTGFSLCIRWIQLHYRCTFIWMLGCLFSLLFCSTESRLVNCDYKLSLLKKEKYFQNITFNHLHIG